MAFNEGQAFRAFSPPLLHSSQELHWHVLDVRAFIRHPVESSEETEAQRG